MLVVYIGASYGMKTKDHIRVVFIREMLPPFGRKILEIFTDLVWVAFNIAVVVISIQLYPKLQRYIGESAILEIPLHWIFLTVPIGCGLVTIRLIQGYIQKYTGKEGA